MELNFNEIFRVLCIIVAAIFCSFAKELNDKAKNPTENFLIFISEILLNGICGVLIGFLSMSFTENLAIMIIASSTSGIFGIDLLKYIVKLVIAYAAAAKRINISEVNSINIDFKDDTKNDFTTLEKSKKEEETPKVNNDINPSLTDNQEIIRNDDDCTGA